MRQHTPDHDRGHAVVLGGSLAGLAAAAAVMPHYERVTLVERDRFPEDPVFRGGVPQARHLHLLWDHGLELLDKLVPGTAADLLGSGAVLVEMPRDVLWLNAVGWSRRMPSTHRILSCSRDLIDWTVRRRLELSGRVRFLTGCEATGLLREADRVAGVRLRARPGRDDATPLPGELEADLVVDTTGRSSRTPRWLGELGWTPPRETVVDSQLGYASRTYALPEGLDVDWKMLFVQAQPPRTPRAGVLASVEGGSWAVSLTGGGGDCPPTDEAGFLDFARSLRSSVLFDTIKDARPLTPIHGYRRTENRRRRYERLRDHPAGLLVLGDAACALNPVYGHGMTVALREATALSTALAKRFRPGDRDAGPYRRLQRGIARCTAGAWLIATSSDLRYPTTQGARPALTDRLVQRYFDRLIATSCGNPEVAARFLDVLNLTAPPTTVLRPRTALRVLSGGPGPLAEPPVDTGDAPAMRRQPSP